MPVSVKKYIPLKPVLFEILLALADEPLHGYAILGEVKARSEGSVRLETGPLYRHLKRLLLDGLVTETASLSGDPEEDERRRYYTLTELGREVIRLETERLTALLARSHSLGLAQG